MEKKSIKLTKGNKTIVQYFRINEDADRVDVATEENGKMFDECFHLTMEQYRKVLLEYKKNGYTATDITNEVFK